MPEIHYLLLRDITGVEDIIGADESLSSVILQMHSAILSSQQSRHISDRERPSIPPQFSLHLTSLVFKKTAHPKQDDKGAAKIQDEAKCQMISGIITKTTATTQRNFFLLSQLLLHQNKARAFKRVVLFVRKAKG